MSAVHEHIVHRTRTCEAADQLGRGRRLHDGFLGASTMRKIANFTLFFGEQDALSNWHRCQFAYHGVNFTSVEQFMMFSKAKLFGDEAAAEAILAARHPKDQKAI